MNLSRREALKTAAGMALGGLLPTVVAAAPTPAIIPLAAPKLFTYETLVSILNVAMSERIWNFNCVEGDTIKEKYDTLQDEIVLAAMMPSKIVGSERLERLGEVLSPSWIVCNPQVAMAIACHENFKPTPVYNAAPCDPVLLGKVSRPLASILGGSIAGRLITVLHVTWQVYACPHFPAAILVGGGTKRLFPECYARIHLVHFPFQAS